MIQARLADADSELEWGAAVAGGVELGLVLEGACGGCREELDASKIPRVESPENGVCRR